MRFLTILLLLATYNLSGQTAYWAATYKEHIKRGSTVLLAKEGYTFERTTYDLYIEKFYADDNQAPNQIITYADRRRKVLEGPWKTYYPNGQLETKGHYLEGEKSNRWYFYRSNGDLIKICTYPDGIEECEFQEQEVLADAEPVAQRGKTTAKRIPVRRIPDNKITDTETPPNDGDEPMYKVVEEMPRFPGCEHLPDLDERKQCAQKGLLEAIYKRLHFPKDYTGPQGTVVITFVVEKDGAITNARIVRSVEPSLDEDALAAILALPNFIPGRQQGEPVRVQFNMPVKYQRQ